MKYHLVILGCQMNISDGERVKTAIEDMGYTETDNEGDAHLLGVLACSVRQKSIDKVYSRIQKWNKRKKSENVLTFISGCILPADKEKFLKMFDFVLQLTEINKLPELITGYGIVSPVSLTAYNDIKFIDNNLNDFWHISPHHISSFEAYIPIQNGCDKFCTFCAVPYTRGREISRPSEEIINEFKYFLEKGYKSITLLGQNVNSYGLDKAGSEISFAGLLEEIGKAGDASGKECLVYFTSPHPCDMNEDVFLAMAKYKTLAKQLHLPLQSGDDTVLKNMNRKHDYARFRDIIKSMRSIIPQATFFTDIIVGFPGETDEQFENTRLALEELKCNMAYIARYSPRPGAVSEKWDDDIPHTIKTKRLATAGNEMRKHSLIYNKSLVGTTQRILVTGKDRKEGYLSGYNEGHIVARFKSTDVSLIGTFVNILITSASDLSVEGEHKI